MTRLRLLFAGPLVTVLACASNQGATFRPPAVPLITHDPYFSIWSPADKLTDKDTVHWTGKPHRLTSLVRIDGRGFRLMGAEPASLPALPQTGLEVTPTRTICTFEGEGVRLTLTFMTPALPDDLEVLSRPVTYLTWEMLARDGKGHGVQIYCEASPEIAVNEPRQMVTGTRADLPGLQVLRVGSVEQPVLRKKGDDLRIDWGHLLMAAPATTRSAVAFASGTRARETFAASGKLTTGGSDAISSTEAGASPGVIFTSDMAGAGAGAVRGDCWLMLAYDDEFSIKYFKQNLRPYWRRNGDDAAALLKKAAADYEPLKQRCEKFDAELTADLRQAGGEKYAQLCALAYRQTFAGNKVVADAGGQPLMFPKENFSNGCIGTVDVLFPQAPFFLVFSPALTKAMLVPILDYAASPRWPYAYAPHDLGTYPHATGQVYGMGGKDGDRMPVEESGNMLIMLAALAKEEGSAGFSKPYWPMLTRWADYLVKEGLDPQNQLCSADMFGHLPRNANLALKAVIGIGAFAQLCERAGQPDEAKKYLGIARDYAARWQELARDEGHTVLAYGQPGTWAMKHNLIWDRVVGLNLFPQSVGDAEIAWYLKVQKKYGLPVDNRTDTCLIDWALWSIAPARSDADFQALLDPIWRYANETPQRVPLGDWFVTTTAAHKAMQARPVVGGLFIKLLANPATWTKWANRGVNTIGPWAGFPIGSAAREIQSAAVKSVRLILPPRPGPVTENAGKVFARQVRQRCEAGVVTADAAPLTVELAVEKGIGAEGYLIEERPGGGVRIAGNDERGLVAGVGKFLRTSRYDQGGFTPGTWRGTSVPARRARGIYFATHFHNFYHDAPVPEVERYVEDLALWGLNELVVWYDAHHFNGADDPNAVEFRKRLHAIMAAAKRTGMDVSLVVIGNEAYGNSPAELRAAPGGGRGGFYPCAVCPSKPEGMKYVLKILGEEFDWAADLKPRSIWIWPYDQGGCGCAECQPWGSKGFMRCGGEVGRLARKKLPGVKIVLSTWFVNNSEWSAIKEQLARTKDLADEIVHEPSNGPTIDPKDHGLPIFGFPEISMHETFPWGAFGATQLTARAQGQWNAARGGSSGGFPYSEGIYEDLTKVVYSQFYWNDKPAAETVREYIAFEYSPGVVDEIAGVVKTLEQNHHLRWWPGELEGVPLEMNWFPSKGAKPQADPGAEEAYSTMQRVDELLALQTRRSWRWRQLYLRALLDAELKANGGKPNDRCNAAFAELIKIYHAENASDTVRPPLPKDYQGKR